MILSCFGRSPFLLSAVVVLVVVDVAVVAALVRSSEGEKSNETPSLKSSILSSSDARRLRPIIDKLSSISYCIMPCRDSSTDTTCLSLVDRGHCMNRAVLYRVVVIWVFQSNVKIDRAAAVVEKEYSGLP